MKENESINITADLVLFFDMDGTLIDTNLANFNSYRKAIISVTKSDNKIPFDPAKRFNRSSLKTVVPNLTETEYEKIVHEKEKCYESFLHQTSLINENVQILLEYSDTNKTVLVTNCRKDRALMTLDHHGIKNKFSTILCREFGVNKKEKINKFQNAISKLGVPPSFVIAFENEETEIADARESGIKVINPIIV